MSATPPDECADDDVEYDAARAELAAAQATVGERVKDTGDTLDEIRRLLDRRVAFTDPAWSNAIHQLFDHADDLGLPLKVPPPDDIWSRAVRHLAAMLRLRGPESLGDLQSLVEGIAKLPKIDADFVTGWLRDWAIEGHRAKFDRAVGRNASGAHFPPNLQRLVEKMRKRRECPCQGWLFVDEILLRRKDDPEARLPDRSEERFSRN